MRLWEDRVVLVRLHQVLLIRGEDEKRRAGGKAAIQIGDGCIPWVFV
jgi:hypothetical protein